MVLMHIEAMKEAAAAAAEAPRPQAEPLTAGQHFENVAAGIIEGPAAVIDAAHAGLAYAFWDHWVEDPNKFYQPYYLSQTFKAADAAATYTYDGFSGSNEAFDQYMKQYWYNLYTAGIPATYQAVEDFQETGDPSNLEFAAGNWLMFFSAASKARGILRGRGNTPVDPAGPGRLEPGAKPAEGAPSGGESAGSGGKPGGPVEGNAGGEMGPPKPGTEPQTPPEQVGPPKPGTEPQTPPEQVGPPKPGTVEGEGGNPVDPARPAQSEGLTDHILSEDFQELVKDVDHIDCSDLAENLQCADGGKGQIMEITPPEGSDLVVPESDGTAVYKYHQVYVRDGMVYDPRFSNTPIPLDEYLARIQELNPGGITTTRR
jgi:hypothetical protein